MITIKKITFSLLSLMVVLTQKGTVDYPKIKSSPSLNNKSIKGKVNDYKSKSTIRPIANKYKKLKYYTKNKSTT